MADSVIFSLSIVSDVGLWFLMNIRDNILGILDILKYCSDRLSLSSIIHRPLTFSILLVIITACTCEHFHPGILNRARMRITAGKNRIVRFILDVLISFLMFLVRNKRAREIMSKLYEYKFVRNVVDKINSIGIRYISNKVSSGMYEFINESMLNNCLTLFGTFPHKKECIVKDKKNFIILDVLNLGLFVIPKYPRVIDSKNLSAFRFTLNTGLDDWPLISSGSENISPRYPYRMPSPSDLGGKSIDVYLGDELVKSFQDDEVPNLELIMNYDKLEDI